ncbi:MAG: hypothetical protein WKG07_10160 [Hymenobacter sp.]
MQGTHLPVLYKHATKALLDGTPAALLDARRVWPGRRAGRGARGGRRLTAAQMSQSAGSCFNYDAFWT